MYRRVLLLIAQGTFRTTAILVIGHRSFERRTQCMARPSLWLSIHLTLILTGHKITRAQMPRPGLEPRTDMAGNESTAVLMEVISVLLTA